MNILTVLVKSVRFLLAASVTIGAMLVISLGIVLLFGLQKLLPLAPVQKAMTAAIETVALWWPVQNHFVLRYLTPVEWQISGLETIDPSKNYLVIANHQSWVDIPVLEEALYRRTGFSRYFIKKSLLHIPFVGWACRALGFPAMHRYQKSMLVKNPALKGKDTEITRRSCLALKGLHFKLNNFIEGTRFTEEKHRRQQSPYRYLLKPKAGGLSYALNILHEQLDGILNVTITYVGSPKTLLGVYLGRVKKIVVVVEKLDLQPEWVGDYEEDRDFRVAFQAWLNRLWLEKDRQMQAVLDGVADR